MKIIFLRPSNFGLWLNIFYPGLRLRLHGNPFRALRLTEADFGSDCA